MCHLTYFYIFFLLTWFSWLFFFLFCLHCIYTVYIVEAVKILECNTCICKHTHAYAFTKQNTPKADFEMQTIYVAYYPLFPHGQNATALSSPQHPCHHTLMYLFIVCLPCPSFSIYLNPILKVPSSPWSLLKYFNPFILSPLKSYTYHYYMATAGVMICTSKFHKTLNTKRPHNEYHLNVCLINKHSYSSIFSYFLFM